MQTHLLSHAYFICGFRIKKPERIRFRFVFAPLVWRFSGMFPVNVLSFRAALSRAYWPVNMTLHIALLAGSPSAQSRTTRLLEHVGERLATFGLTHTLLQVRDLPPAALLHADFRDPEVQAAQQIINSADAVVIATPIYKASFSGVLKTFLDLLAQDALAGKPVLPLAIGGSQSHMLVIDYALRPVLAALGAPHILPGIYATENQIKWQGDDVLVLDASIAERITTGIGHLCGSLHANSSRSETAPALLRRA